MDNSIHEIEMTCFYTEANIFVDFDNTHVCIFLCSVCLLSSNVLWKIKSLDTSRHQIHKEAAHYFYKQKSRNCYDFEQCSQTCHNPVYLWEMSLHSLEEIATLFIGFCKHRDCHEGFSSTNILESQLTVSFQFSSKTQHFSLSIGYLNVNIFGSIFFGHPISYLSIIFSKHYFFNWHF